MASDLVASCREKLHCFRIKELKDVLTQLSLSKQGKKQDLIERILSLVSDDQVSSPHMWGKRNSLGKEGVAKIIEDIYRKMQAPGATELASKSHSGSDFSRINLREEIDSSYQFGMKVRCPCGSSLRSDQMIQCEDSKCRVWQHIGCVVVPEKSINGASPEIPPRFYCEICRIDRADPFWVSLAQPLSPMILAPSGFISNSSNTLQNVEKTFMLSRSDTEMLKRTEYDLQVWCLLLNDKVPFRMQWPQYAELQVNGITVRVVTRPGSQLLGISGRDDGPVITTCCREGINKISLTRCDARIFCFGIRLAKRRTLQQVLNMVPKEADGERFEDALARVRRCLGGGAPAGDAESDSDIEVVADSVTINLRCPMSGSRIKIAGRFKPCAHMGCFDLEAFVELNQRSRKWQCPICLNNYALENLIIDPYFNRITSLLQKSGEDVNEIDVNPDGCWCAKNEKEFKELSKWHLPDSSLCPTVDVEVKPESENLMQMKQEVASDGHAGLKIGIKRNQNGIWEVSKHDDIRLQSSGSHGLSKLNNRYEIVQMSSSATGSSKDGEDASVNQDIGRQFDLSLNNGHELDSLPLSFDTTFDMEDRVPPAPLKGPDVIVLSDSDDDNLRLVSPETAYGTRTANTNEIPFPNHPGVSERYPEDPGLGTNVSSGLGLFGSNTDDFEMPLWPMQTCAPTNSGFQLFGNGADVPDGLVNPHESLNCTELNGYGLASNGGLDDLSNVQNLSTSDLNNEMHESLVDNPLAFGNDDPSLQIFLHSCSAGRTLQSNLSDHHELPNGNSADDWTSLSLAGGVHGDSNPTDEPSQVQQFTPKERRIEPSDEDASLLLSMNDNGGKRENSNKRSDDPFWHPRQPRSVRPRFRLTIDTDSD